jgi:hypothetical protein
MSRRDEDRRAVVTASGVGTFELRPGQSLRVGRHHENDIVVKDSVVSRFHATLRWDETSDRPTLYDNGSQNGTNVNGKDVIGRAEPLGPSSRVVIGSCKLTVELLGTAAAALIDDAPEAVALFSEQGPELRGELDAARALRQLLLRLEVEQRTGTLTLSLPDGLTGSLTLATGRIMAAQIGPLEGPDAIDRMYQATRGSYRFTRDMEPSDQALNIRFSDYLRDRHGSYLGTTKWRRPGEPDARFPG